VEFHLNTDKGQQGIKRLLAGDDFHGLGLLCCRTGKFNIQVGIIGFEFFYQYI